VRFEGLAQAGEAGADAGHRIRKDPTDVIDEPLQRASGEVSL
jgi:hypothetical protein